MIGYLTSLRGLECSNFCCNFLLANQSNYSLPLMFYVTQRYLCNFRNGMLRDLCIWNWWMGLYNNKQWVGAKFIALVQKWSWELGISSSFNLFYHSTFSLVNKNQNSGLPCPTKDGNVVLTHMLNLVSPFSLLIVPCYLVDVSPIWLRNFLGEMWPSFFVFWWSNTKLYLLL